MQKCVPASLLSPQCECVYALSVLFRTEVCNLEHTASQLLKDLFIQYFECPIPFEDKTRSIFDVLMAVYANALKEVNAQLIVWTWDTLIVDIQLFLSCYISKNLYLLNIVTSSVFRELH